MNRSVVGVFVFGTLVVSLFPGSAFAQREIETVPGEFLVRFVETSSFVSSVSRVKNSLAQIFGATSIRSIAPLQMDKSGVLVTMNDPSKVPAAVSQLTQTLIGEVKYAEPNFIYRTNVLPQEKSTANLNGEPNDTDFSVQWDMKNTGQEDRPNGRFGNPGSDINITPLWKEGITGDKNFIVAIIDTGIDVTHPDLAANIFKNTKEILDNGIDDDGNGVIDDVYGANFENGTGLGSGIDDDDHGTHCAGTIGGVGNDHSGISGVNWSVSMLPVKFLAADGKGSSFGAINGIKYAVKMGAKVLSNSWGGGGYSKYLQDTIEEAGNAGVLFVAASGNDSVDDDSDPTYPASYDLPNVISVAATNNWDLIASFSNYGRKTVHLSAPGKNIYSTIRGGGYEILSGTSMAAPHVSGIAALIWSANPTWTPAEVKDRLIRTSTPVYSARAKTVSRGRVNAYNAFHGVIAPTDVPAESEWKTVPYQVASPHPYKNKSNSRWEVSVPGAKFIRVILDRFDTEKNVDILSIESTKGEVAETLSGVRESNYVTEYVRGDKAIIHLKSDKNNNAFGFKVKEVQIVK